MFKKLPKIIKFISSNDLALACLAVILVVIVGVFIGWTNNEVIPLYANPHFHYLLEPHNHLEFLSNWDGPIYLAIAAHGYKTFAETNFFPLYPILVYLVHFIIPSLLDSGLIVSWLSFVGATYFFIKIAKQLYSLKKFPDKLMALSFFVLFPTAVFFIATYTESLFALLSLGAIYFALNNRYILASLMLMFATATHITGIFVLALVGLILLEQKIGFIKSTLSVIVGSLGLDSYMLYLYIKFHDPLDFIKSQQQIHGWLEYNFSRLFSTADPYTYIFIIFLVIAIIYWWDRRKSFAVYSFLFLLIPIVGGQFGGFNRYVLMAFPVQWMLVDYFKNKRNAFAYVLALMAIFWAYFSLQYFGGYVGS